MQMYCYTYIPTTVAGSQSVSATVVYMRESEGVLIM